MQKKLKILRKFGSSLLNSVTNWPKMEFQKFTCHFEERTFEYRYTVSLFPFFLWSLSKSSITHHHLLIHALQLCELKSILSVRIFGNTSNYFSRKRILHSSYILLNYVCMTVLLFSFFHLMKLFKTVTRKQTTTSSSDLG